MKRIFLFLLPLILLFSCAPQQQVKNLEPNSLSYKVEKILNNQYLTPEQKRKLILQLFAQKRKEWSGENIYQKEKALKIAKVLKQPSIPIYIPPKIIRVLILPWTDKNNVFHGAHYVYFKVEDTGKWILETYQTTIPNPQKTLTPLEEEK